MVICYLGIGANLGNRRKNIEEAIKKIKELKQTKVLKVSRLIQTKPVGGPSGQPDFLNAALKIQTRITPLNLLKELKTIEKELGRVKTVRNGPRTIDLDILFYGNKIIQSKVLTVPHPRMFAREFVLKPLAEVI